MSEVAKIEEGSAVVILTPMEMLNQAVSNNAGVETLEKLMGLQERWEANEARKAFDAAMSSLRGELPEIVKRSEVDFTSQKGRTNYKYEDLSSVTAALSPVMARHGLSFRWRTNQENGGVAVTCIISHRDGHYEETSLHASPDNSGNKNAIQALGSAVTYLQRYTLKAAVGVAASADDDGQGAGGSAWAPQERGEPAHVSTLAKGPARDLYTELQQDIDSADSLDALQVWKNNRSQDAMTLPHDWRDELRSRYMNRFQDLQTGGSNVQ